MERVEKENNQKSHENKSVVTEGRRGERYVGQRSAVCDVWRWYNLERSDTPVPNMGVATNGSETAYCVLGVVHSLLSISFAEILYHKGRKILFLYSS